MPVAPIEWPPTAPENTMPVACLEGAASWRREGPTGVNELVLELGLAGDSTDRRVAGVALDRLRRHGAATLELACRGALDPGQRVEAGANDQLRPRPRAVALAP